MAIVRNISRQTDFIDPSFCSPNRVNAGEPNGSIIPQYNGEIIEDTTGNCLWKAMYPLSGVTNTCWVALTPPN